MTTPAILLLGAFLSTGSAIIASHPATGDTPNIEVAQRKPADCHRDVRTHRIHGVRIRHRHVGDDCAVREVRSSTTSAAEEPSKRRSTTSGAPSPR